MENTKHECNQSFERTLPISGYCTGHFHVFGHWSLVISLLLAQSVLISCKKDKKEYDAVPHIDFVSVTPSSIIQNQDSLTFTIKYTDGDGDLGENSPDAKNLFLTDNRINISYPYRVEQLAPSGSSIAIKGNLNVVLKNISLTDSSNQQTTTFSIYVVDRAGHHSNSVTSTPVTINR